MTMADEGKVPWLRLLLSFLGALVVAVAGFIAHLAGVEEPRPLHIGIETVALPFVRLVHWIGGVHRGPAIGFAALSSVLLWWALLFAFLTRRARKRNGYRPT
jgi:hypothetical protein